MGVAANDGRRSYHGVPRLFQGEVADYRHLRSVHRKKICNGGRKSNEFGSDEQPVFRLQFESCVPFFAFYPFSVLFTGVCRSYAFAGFEDAWSEGIKKNALSRLWKARFVHFFRAQKV